MIRLSNETLSAYIDGELCAETMAQVELDLAGDPEARRRLARLREADALIRGGLAEPPPPWRE